MSKHNEDEKPDFGKWEQTLATMTALGEAEAEIYGQSGHKAVIVEQKR